MKLAVPKEIADDETRVAMVPADVAKFVKSGMEVIVEAGAGIASCAADDDYRAKGASIEADARKLLGEADVIVKVCPPCENASLNAHEVDLMKEGALLCSLLWPMTNIDLVEKLVARKVTALAMDCIPRISRAQSMDVLSSMSTVGGYKAVLLAANRLPKMMPMMMTAAGTIAPGKVFVLGAGVAGLQAIATARRLGATVEAFDTRAAVKEQVLSLGGRFVELDIGHGDAEDAGGYAKELSEEHHRKELELLAKHVKVADVVITTALIPGRKAPILVTEEMVKSMRPGSVIVDMAAETGGNCALTEPGKEVVKHGVTICGQLNLPGTIPVHASQMFSRNMYNLLSGFWKDGSLTLDPDDEIVAGAVITRDGEVVHQGTRERMVKEGVS
ncbi:MAG: Re/Si-specific NAD(P)(+) transhydrogenase subunit alpha [Planctomycetes bacterium]|nr:Re/Si-specific NAD(P)(+) transhydrogenase subunit alpha [Planctomycetota bacterium]